MSLNKAKPLKSKCYSNEIDVSIYEGVGVVCMAKDNTLITKYLFVP